MSVAMSPLPLSYDGSSRFLPWLIALMVFVVALSIAGASIIDSGLTRWNQTLQGNFTAELPQPESGALSKDRIDTILTLLTSTQGVYAARSLDDATTLKLLEPWLGKTIEIGQLPLPVLIDIQLKPHADIDRTDLENRLAALVPGSLIERRGAWLDALFHDARAVEIVLSVLILLVGCVAILAVIFTTKTGLALHSALINLLHVMGASDSYIAGHFQRHAFRMAFGGGTIGVVAAFFAIGAFRFSYGSRSVMPLIGDRLPLGALLSLFCLPLIVGGVGWLTAGLTVRRSIANMP